MPYRRRLYLHTPHLSRLPGAAQQRMACPRRMRIALAGKHTRFRGLSSKLRGGKVRDAELMIALVMCC